MKDFILFNLASSRSRADLYIETDKIRLWDDMIDSVRDEAEHSGVGRTEQQRRSA